MASLPADDKKEWKEGKADSLSATDEKNSRDLEGSSIDDDTRPLLVDKKILRKVDLNLIPLIAILYLCSFLDRGNIGNARVAGMATDLKLTGIKYQLAAAVFFIPYSLMEIPCNVIMKKMRPSLWIPSIMFVWGIVMMSMAFVKSYHTLIVARVFLGLAEAGLPPGVAYLVTMWYRKEDQARPISLYFSSATVAGAFGGLLAFAIEKLNKRGNLAGWAWIFLLEGLLTVVFSLLAFWKLPNYPAEAKFLTTSEREHLVEVLRRDTAGEASHFEMKMVWEVLLDWKSYLITSVYLGMAIPLYSFSLFLPTIITGLGFSANKAQLLTIPPYALGCICTIVIGSLSDRYKLRGPFVMGLSAFAIIGYAIIDGTNPKTQPGAGYAATIIAACGVFPTVPIMLAWGSGNAGSSLKKAVVIGLLSGIGNLGGIASSFIYRTQDTPRFHLGHGIAIGFLCMAFVSSSIAVFVFNKINKERDELCVREGITPDRKDEFQAMGNASPLFRFAL